MDDYEIKREEFISDIEEEKEKERLLRKYIRKKLQEKYASKLKKENEMEQELRKYVRSLIKEAKESRIPYDSTGINILEDVLKQIVPIIREDYKTLTTDSFQRKSFREHVISAIKQTILPIQDLEKASGGDADADDVDAGDQKGGDSVELEKDEEGRLPPANREVDEEELPDDLQGVDQDKMIDVDDEEDRYDPDEQEDQKSSEDDDDLDFEVPGEDKTGRNLAMKSYNRIEEHIKDAYRLLSNEEDKQLFYDFLISNIKAYFQRWEEELSIE